MSIANVVISIIGAAVNLYLLALHPRSMYAVLTIVLTLRAVYYGSRARAKADHGKS